MTFSLLGRCGRTGALGMVIASSSPAVAARCAHARAHVGAVATQNVTDPRLGAQGLDLMASGRSAGVALARLRETAPHLDYRQLALLDANGEAAVFSGAHALGCHAALTGDGAAAAGNLLADAAVPDRMLAAFQAEPEADLPDRLIAALRAGSEAGPVHSAGLLVVRDQAFPLIDLRVDWHADDPVGALAALWEVYRPQVEDYVTRALDPRAAPRYGVKGEV